MGSQNHNSLFESWDSLITSGCDDVDNSNTEMILVICDEELKLY